MLDEVTSDQLISRIGDDVDRGVHVGQNINSAPAFSHFEQHNRDCVMHSAIGIKVCLYKP